MGCAASADLTPGHPIECRLATSGELDLALHPTLDDAAAAAIAATVAVTPTTALVAPRWPCPDAPLTHVGLLHLCLAAAPALRTLELNEAAIPRVTGWGAARALRILTELREVSLRGDTLPAELLGHLSTGRSPPAALRSVRTVLLAGGAVAAALPMLPVVFGATEVLCLQQLPDNFKWDVLGQMLVDGRVLPNVRRVIVDGQASVPPSAVAALRKLCPRLKLTFDGAPAIHATIVPNGPVAAAAVAAPPVAPPATGAKGQPAPGDPMEVSVKKLQRRDSAFIRVASSLLLRSPAALIVAVDAAIAARRDAPSAISTPASPRVTSPITSQRTSLGAATAARAFEAPTPPSASPSWRSSNSLASPPGPLPPPPSSSMRASRGGSRVSGVAASAGGSQRSNPLSLPAFETGPAIPRRPASSGTPPSPPAAFVPLPQAAAVPSGEFMAVTMPRPAGPVGPHVSPPPAEQRMMSVAPSDGPTPDPRKDTETPIAQRFAAARATASMAAKASSDPPGVGDPSNPLLTDIAEPRRAETLAVTPASLAAGHAGAHDRRMVAEWMDGVERAESAPVPPALVGRSPGASSAGSGAPRRANAVQHKTQGRLSIASNDV